MKGTYLNRATTSEMAVFQRSTYIQEDIYCQISHGWSYISRRQTLTVCKRAQRQQSGRILTSSITQGVTSL